MAICKSCGAHIIWGKIGMKNIPLDHGSDEDRLVVLDDTNGVYLVARRKTFQTHFATCPHAKQHRRKNTDNPPPQGEKE